jgi:hypothetical protein
MAGKTHAWSGVGAGPTQIVHNRRASGANAFARRAKLTRQTGLKLANRPRWTASRPAFARGSIQSGRPQ